MSKKSVTLCIIIFIVLISAVIYLFQVDSKVFPSQNRNPIQTKTVSQNIIGVFNYAVPTDNFEKLTLQDFPTFENYSLHKVVRWKDRLFAFSSIPETFIYNPDIIQLDLNGNLIAFSDKEILNCSPSDLAVSGDFLFVACNPNIYKIDLQKNQIVYTYSETNGLLNTQNLQLAISDNTLWVATFEGLAKIDINTDKVSFYGPELQATECQEFPNTSIHSRNQEVWVRIISSAFCKGGVSRYNQKTDSWTFYGPENFNKRELSRVDFSDFIVSDQGVYATHQDSGPEFQTISKFNTQNNKWEQILLPDYGDTEKYISELLPPLETYTDILKDDSNYYKTKSITLFNPEPKSIPIKANGYFDMVRIDDIYYLLSSNGIDTFTAQDQFPKTLITSKNVYYDKKAQLLSTNDNNYLVFLSISFSDYGGEILEYGTGVYNLIDQTFFEASIKTTELNANSETNPMVINQIFDNYELIYNPNEIKIPVGGGEIVIDLINKKISAKNN